VPCNDENLLGPHQGDDGSLGHLGYAAKVFLKPFGRGVFNKKSFMAVASNTISQ
jgi:hypothetical protein